MQLEDRDLGVQRRAGRLEGWLEDVLVELLGVRLGLPYLRNLDDTICLHGAVHDQTERMLMLDVHHGADSAIGLPADVSLHDPENGHAAQVTPGRGDLHARGLTTAARRARPQLAPSSLE